METANCVELKKASIKDDLKQLGWQQGACLEINEHSPLVKQEYLKIPGLYLVITQTCDLLHPKLDVEPFVELIYAKKINKKDKGVTGGKSLRKIHIDITVGENKHPYECSIHDKYRLPREHLKNIPPSKTHRLSEKECENLINWLIKRYKRVAFPDSFEQRLKIGFKDEIADALKKCSEKNLGVFLNMDLKELDKDTPYDIKIYMLVENHSSAKELGHFRNALEGITTIFVDGNNIIVSDYDVKKLEDISAEEYLNLCQYYFDYLSYQD